MAIPLNLTPKNKNNAIAKCLKYAEKKKELKKLLKKIDIVWKFTKYDFYFKGDKDKRIILNVRIKREAKEILYTFGMSTHDYKILTKKSTIKNNIEKEKVKEDILYNLLTCIKSDSYIEENFDSFVANYGYEYNTEKEYIKIKQLHFDCIDMKEKIFEIFEEKEIEFLPD